MIYITNKAANMVVMNQPIAGEIKNMIIRMSISVMTPSIHDVKRNASLGINSMNLLPQMAII